MNKQGKKMIAPNKLDVIKKQMGKLWDKVEVPNEIQENEKGYYHVAIVESTPDSKRLEYSHKLKIQKFNDRSWESIKKQLKQLGYSNVFILHDPSGVVEEEGQEEGSEEVVVDRAKLIEEAKSYGYEGKLNVSNKVLQEFIEKTKEQIESEK